MDIVGNLITVSELKDMLDRMYKRIDEGKTFSEASIPEIVENLMPASVPEIAKVLSIPCPHCGAIEGQFCDKVKGTVCGERIAMTVRNDAMRHSIDNIPRASIHSFEDNGKGRCRHLIHGAECGYEVTDPLHNLRYKNMVQEVLVKPSQPSANHKFENGFGTGLCSARLGNTACNAPADHDIHKEPLKLDRINTDISGEVNG